MSAEMCSSHSFRREFLCLDPKCRAEPQGCVICIKNAHSKCSEDFVVSLEEEKKKVKVQPVSQAVKRMVAKLEDSIDRRLFAFNVDLKKQKNEKVSGMLEEKPSESSGSDVWTSLKRSSKIEMDPTTKIITMKSTLEGTPEEEEKALKSFDRSLEKCIEEFKERFSKMRLMVGSYASSIVWRGSDRVQIEQSGPVFKFTREPSTRDQENYFFKLFETSLPNFKAKVTVHAFNDSDRYVDVGLFEESRIKALESANFITDFVAGDFCFCGYRSHNLVGRDLGQQMDSGGFTPGYEFFVEFTDGERILFYDELNTLRLEGATPCKKGVQYYLYVVLYHSETSCTIEFF